MKDIKLFVCCHRAEYVPEHMLLYPIQVGAAFSEKRFEGFLQDDVGENISPKNRSYCELTAQYWAWKNVDANYYGFFHYRRYLYPDLKARRSYTIRRLSAQAILNKLGYDDLARIVEQYDLIVPIGEDMHISVREHYAGAPHHCSKDLTLIESIVSQMYPQMKDAMEAYLSGTVHYFGNIYIMCREVFHDYCAWLFPLLEEFDRHTDLMKRSLPELRVDGYLAERLLGVYYTQKKNGLRTLELPRVHFYTGWEYVRLRLLNAFLPPGTQRRAAVKAMRRNPD